MANNFDARGDGLDGRSERAPHGPDTQQPLTDREVPLGSARTPAAIHAWLDGELPESSLSGAELARDIDFWRRIGEETESRRHLRTPAHVQGRIMEAIVADRSIVTTPWHERTLTVRPVVAIATAAALVGAGALVTLLLTGSAR